MDKTWLFALLSTVFVSLLSFIGVFLLSFQQDKLKKILILLMCFAVGVLLGNSFFHLLPESYFHIHETSYVAWACIGGFLIFFFIEQILHIRTHQNKGNTNIKSYGYLNLYADGVHNFVDGILIAVTWLYTPELGIATTLTIILHEIPQEISDFGVLLQAGFSRKKALLYNFISACSAILGTVVTLLIGEKIEHFSTYLLPFAAGGFIYLAASSLLPEIVKLSNKRNYWLYIICIVLGILLMYFFSATGGHSHGHAH